MVDPRQGDIEDDASSTKQRSLFSLAGTLLAEVSLPKLALAWILLVGLPGLLIGAAPLVTSIWIAGVSSKASALLTGLWPALLLSALAVLGWLGGWPLLRLAENSFWSLNALTVQPGYVLCREAFRHIAERLLPSDMNDDQHAFTRAASAAVSSVVICGLALWLVALAWPSTRWVGNLSDLASPHRLAVPALFNSAVIIAGYLAVAALIWGTADATMAHPRDYKSFQAAPVVGRTWRVAHLSDIHVVGERYGFRIESGRSGPRGNDKFKRTLAQLERIHAENPLDAILITGDVTDAGRAAEWAEFFDALAPHRQLSELLLFLPGNHDLNVMDRANPARLDLPTSPRKRLRQIRTISALEALQGSRVRLVDIRTGRLGASLSEALKPHLDDIAAFADQGSFRLSRSLAQLWATSFPMVQPPETENGLGIILLNSNVEAHFSFTNALGLVSTEQARAIDIIAGLYPQAYWIVALHHHVVEYPKRAKALSERIGTALINGSWFVRHLRRFADRAVVMHGHRHIDWMGECGGLSIVSAPSPVMEVTDEYETYFYIHTLAIAGDGRLRLMKPERIGVAGQQVAETRQ
jgi:predicted MPP superfamily phosphohydrolase